MVAEALNHDASDDEHLARESREKRRRLRQPGTTLEDLRQALQDDDPAVRRVVLDHPLCPMSWRREAVIGDPDAAVAAVGVLSLGRYEHLPADWRQSRHMEVRQAVAGLPDCPPDVVRTLAIDDPSLAVRKVALPRLVTIDPDAAWDVVYGDHPYDADLVAPMLEVAPSDVARAAGIPHQGVRVELAERGSCPLDLLAHFALRDPSPTVRAVAVRDDRLPPGLLGQILSDPAPEPRAAAVARQDFPQELLAQAATDESAIVRMASLTHGELPVDAVGRLASFREPDKGVRLRAIGHPRCPLPVLTQAWASHDPHVRWTAMSAPRTLPTDVVWHYLKRASRRLEANDAGRIRGYSGMAVEEFEAAVSQLRRAPWAAIRELPLEELSASTCAAVLAGHLEDAVRDHRVAIRIAVAQHPDVDAACLAVLGTDVDEHVRAEASRRVMSAL